MTLASFQLESFSAAKPGRQQVPTFLQADLDQAFSDGLAEGVAKATDDQLRNLEAGLARLGKALTDDSLRRAEMRKEAVSALAPILDAIIDNLAPAAESRRLEEALLGELVRLSETAQPLRARISCGARQTAMVRKCLGQLEIENIEVTETEDNRINLTLQGGRIEISAEQIAQEIRAIIHELNDGS